MKHYLRNGIVLLLFFTLLFSPVKAQESEYKDYNNAVYLGVSGYNTMYQKYKDDFYYKFFIDDGVYSYKISNLHDYKINNILEEGKFYDLRIKDNTIVDAKRSEPKFMGKTNKITDSSIMIGDLVLDLGEKMKVYEVITKPGGASIVESDLKIGDYAVSFKDDKNIFIISPTYDYEAPVKGTPGLRTIKNFIKTSFEPVGTTLYIYGGAWDFQDIGSSNQARKIGLDSSYTDFFKNNDLNFTYKAKNPLNSYYPSMQYNEYYYAGMDCSGYVGWAMYNLLNTQSNNKGYVEPAKTMSQTFSEKLGLGTKTLKFKPSDFKPGDIYSMSGHVWISLGACKDNSILILHSTPSDSYTKMPGGGVQLSALGKKGSEAHKLASVYMNRYYNQWNSRYPVAVKSYKDYTDKSKDVLGKFSFNINETGVLDPDGYLNMTPRQVLADVFSEDHVMTDEELNSEFKKVQNFEKKQEKFYELMKLNNSNNFEKWKNSTIEEITSEINKFKI